MPNQHIFKEFVFDMEKFVADLESAAERDGIGIDEVFVMAGYARTNAVLMRKPHWYLSMSKFVALCNAVDLDPRRYIALED